MSPETLQAIIATLEGYSSCDISDGLVKFGFKNGGHFPNVVRQSSNSKFPVTVGQAYTVLFAPYDDPRPEISGGYIDNLPKNSVLVIGTTPALQIPHYPFTLCNNALYGGLMSTRAKFLGSKGTVVFGRVRDLDEHQELDHAVYSYALGTTAHKPVVKMIGINVPLDIYINNYPTGSFETINPGDFIICDVNGVVRLPLNYEVDSHEGETLSKILDYIPRRKAADELVAADIKGGATATGAQKARRQGL